MMGVIDDSDAVTETYIMIKNVMDKHIPEAVADYRRLHDLDSSPNKTVVISAEKSSTESSRADTTKIKNSDMTGRQAPHGSLEHSGKLQFDGATRWSAIIKMVRSSWPLIVILQQRFEK